jgi:F-type H+-transporting ATPase subunit alpha
LERSTHLSKALKGGSLTALPIIETEAQDISAYIPTNLISITDGQIYLSPTLFESGILPAVDVGKSVSRVGANAQLPAFRSISELKLQYSQFEELESFARFGTRLDENTQKTINHGNRIRECLKQNELAPLSVAKQIIVLLSLTSGLFDDIAIEKIPDTENALLNNMNKFPAELLKSLLSDKPLSDQDRDAILKIAGDLVAPFKNKTEPAQTQ